MNTLSHMGTPPTQFLAWNFGVSLVPCINRRYSTNGILILHHHVEQGLVIDQVKTYLKPNQTRPHILKRKDFTLEAWNIWNTQMANLENSETSQINYAETWGPNLKLVQPQFVFLPSGSASCVSVNGKDLNGFRQLFFSSLILLIVNERALAEKSGW